ncbi:branched-chain amino acid ABC transporter permease [Ralstonia nicotianae]|uniref:Branched-chain amino acid ABC transporter permease n=1 Tax=Ralstonia pseudosolanacearum TaxID=1310165 RepID=A0A454TPN5_9RALS|nr:branched-chain amino acid ABC transporter permease [Ralstonia pseudosolanacearum]MCK4133813.1 branched-chain amino acid ABC transporter permease [Ralstonia pseudosolanacearum]MDK1381556.1 branched-chain amino acid ABC transporter permease [Ralstonia pseudosolanacearum]RAA10853.1 branched-chain amino acid ABC transporter permease [Ralstonia pseudosolanacearum]RNM05114.1 branched-chain amino acid ABC transporter permease [Ralstonia pseudosolanacearum]
MDLSIAAILAQDGVTSGAIYALLALALVLVFSVTRVIFIPQGEFVAYGALTLAAIQTNRAPLSASLLLALGVLTFVAELGRTLLQPELRRHALRTGAIYAAKYLLFPLAVFAATSALAPMTLPQPVQVALALALLIVIPMGPMIYRLAYEPLAEASTLVLLIVSVGVHFAMVGLGLVMFGAEGSRTEAFSDARFDVGALTVSGQSLWVVMVSALMIVALYFYFGRTVSGKALRATAVNRLGARLVGIGTTQAGRLAFTLAAALGALCGVLIAPLTTVYYESGFLIGLKGFVGAIVGGLVSYPVAAAGALLVGLLESYASFWASAFKEVIVFTLILPVLLWRSLTTRHVEEEE